MSQRAAATAALLALALCTGRALAEDIRVLLIPSGPGDPVAAHLIDELVALGITVEVSPTAGHDLGELAAARGVRAVLRVARSQHEVDLWVEGAPKITPVHEPPDDPRAAGLALRAVELLRGRLLPVERSPEGPAGAGAAGTAAAGTAAAGTAAAGTGATGSTPGPKSAPPKPAPPAAGATPPAPPGPAHDRSATPVAAITPVRRPRISLLIGPAVSVQPGSGLSPSGTAMAGARWMITSRLGADILALVPVLPATVSSPEGQAWLSAAVLGAGAWVNALQPGQPFTMGVGLGLGAGLLSYYGQPATSRVTGRGGIVPYMLPFARWGVAWHALPPLSVRADVVGGLATPRPVFRLAGRSTDAVFGQPLLTFALGVEVAIR